jgi:putative SOS response-associated peptidase YedK
MCGRYAASANPDDLVEEFEVERVDERERLLPDWNVAPTKDVPAVITRRDRDAEEGATPVRLLRPVRWGLVPSWAKDSSIGSRLINARMETVTEKPAYRRAFAKRRCLLPADGYYEWYAAEGGKKQPFYITRRDGRALAMAGLYEFWRDPSADPEDRDAWLWTSTVLTTTAEDDVGRIHDRMPLMVPPERWAEWLDPANDDTAAAADLLVPASPGALDAWPVATLVNNVRNNGPELVDPLPADEAAAGTVAEGPPDGALF